MLEHALVYADLIALAKPQILSAEVLDGYVVDAYEGFGCPEQVVHQLQAEFGAAILQDAGLITATTDSSVQTLHAGLVGPEKTWLILRNDAGSPFDILTDGGYPNGSTAALFQLLSDYRVSKALRHTRRLHLVATIKDVALLRTLGIAAVPYRLFDRIKLDDLKTVLGQVHELMWPENLVPLKATINDWDTEHSQAPDVREFPSPGNPPGAAPVPPMKSTSGPATTPAPTGTVGSPTELRLVGLGPAGQEIDGENRAEIQSSYSEFDSHDDEEDFESNENHPFFQGPQANSFAVGSYNSNWLVVMAWSPSESDPAQPPGCEALIAHLTSMVNHMGLRADGIAVWFSSSEAIEGYVQRLRYGSPALLGEYFSTASEAARPLIEIRLRPVMPLNVSAQRFHDLVNRPHASGAMVELARQDYRRALEALLIDPLLVEVSREDDPVQGIRQVQVATWARELFDRNLARAERLANADHRQRMTAADRENERTELVDDFALFEKIMQAIQENPCHTISHKRPPGHWRRLIRHSRTSA